MSARQVESVRTDARCDACGRFSSDLESITMCIHYEFGPLGVLMCARCRSREEQPTVLRGASGSGVRM